MPTRNIDLTDHLDGFVERQVASGRYGNASEIIREALRILEDQQQETMAKLHVIRQAAKLGFDEIDQGQGIDLKDKNSIRQFISDLESEVKTKTARNSSEK